MDIELKIINLYPHLGGCTTLLKNILDLEISGVRISLLHQKENSNKLRFDLYTIKCFFLDLLKKQTNTLYLSIHMFAYKGLLKNVLFSLFNKNLIVHLSGSLAFHCANHNFLYQFLTRVMLKNARGVICLNKSTLELAKKYNSNCIFLPNFIGISQKETVQRLRKEPMTKDYNFCYHGRLTKDKGLIELLEIIKKLPHYSFLIVGDGDKNIVGELKNLKNVKCIHSIADFSKIVECLLRSEVYIFPSKREGFPFSIIEAMSSSLPVIANNFNDVADIVIEKKGGIILKFNQVNLAKNEIQNLMRNPAFLSEMATFNLEQIEALYSHDKFAVDFGSFLKTI